VRSSQRILHLITELDIGGAQKALARLLSHLDRKRFSPHVACFYNGQEMVAQEIRKLGIPVTNLGMITKWRWDAFWRLYFLLRRERPTILHTWMFHANIPGRVLGRLANVPIVISSERTMGQESPWRYRLNRVTHPLADRITCVSQQVEDFVVGQIGIPRDKTVVIPNGIDVKHFKNLYKDNKMRSTYHLPRDVPVIGTVTRLNRVKRLDVLLQAIELLQETHGVIVGEGPEHEYLKAQATRLGLSERISFTGHQRDVRPWLAAFDIFVLSSDWEGMSNALLEAMAAGLPVVATAVGGTPEVVVEGETGFLVPPRDPEALAEAILRLLRDPDLRRRMGEAGRKRVAEHFSVEQMVQKTEALYEHLVAEKGLA
jgi:sugar transferase (PEP-CTERM/EpsH1 system associated)